MNVGGMAVAGGTVRGWLLVLPSWAGRGHATIVARDSVEPR
jgi:hypothetical protein